MRIGNVEIGTPVALAPMAAVNCLAFRLMAKRYGAGLVSTQEIPAWELALDSEEAMAKYLDVSPRERPLSVQLLAGKPEDVKAAAAVAEPFADILDLNAGCITGQMLGRKTGAYLLKHPEMLGKVLGAMIGATNKPVTLKMRLGWDQDNLDYLKVGRMAQDLGVAAITLHGRTKAQHYMGKADWDAIKQLKEAADVPVIGNGDVTSGNDAKRMMEKTGCDAVMIGRGAIGNPQVFSDAKLAISEGADRPFRRPDPKLFLEFYGIYKDVQKRQKFTELRHHAYWFMKGQPKELQKKVLSAKDETEVLSYFQAL